MNALDLLALSFDDDECEWMVAAAEWQYGEGAVDRACDASWCYHDLYRTNRGKLVFRPGGVYWNPDG